MRVEFVGGPLCGTVLEVPDTEVDPLELRAAVAPTMRYVIDFTQNTQISPYVPRAEAVYGWTGRFGQRSRARIYRFWKIETR